MGYVFVSYARADAILAERFAAALKGAGFDVWIDATGIEEGRAYDRQIEEALRNAGCAVVLWSRASVASEWVRNEAAEAYENGKLLPVLTDDAELPLQFRSVQAIELRNWDGATAHPAFSQLKSAVQRRLSKAGSTVPDEAVAPASAPAGSPLAHALESASLRFADRDRERRFGEFYNERYIHMTRMYLLLTSLFYCLFAFVEMLTVAALTPQSIVFPLLVIPLLLGMFGLSLWPPVQRHFRVVALVVGTVGIALVCFNLKRFATPGVEVTSQMAVLSVLTVLVFAGLVPLRFPDSLVVTLVPVVFALARGPLLDVQVDSPWIENELLLGTYFALTVASWWRERNARRWFLEAARTTR